MKTLVKNGLSIYLFDDDAHLEPTNECFYVGLPLEFVIGDCSAQDTDVFLGVSAPADWTGGKYRYDGADWTLNPDWVEPTAGEESSELRSDETGVA